MKEGYLFFGGAITLLGYSLYIYDFKEWSLSPALFPMVCALLLGFLALLMILQKNNQKQSGAKSILKEKKSCLIKIIALSFIYLFLLSKINFTVLTIAYLSGFTFILGEKRWKVMLSVSVVSTVAIILIFGKILGVVLP